MAASTVEGPVAHHFNNMGQQLATVRFGMWLFLVTEVLFFGGAFCAYTAYRVWYPKDWEAGSAALNVGIASVNTFLLLTSSLTITLAIRAAYVGNIGGLKRNLLLTILLGSAFLGLKAREYHLDYEEGLVPGAQTGMREEAAEDFANYRASIRPLVEPLDLAIHAEATIAFEHGPITPKKKLAEYKYDELSTLLRQVKSILEGPVAGFSENVSIVLHHEKFRGHRTDRIDAGEFREEMESIRKLSTVPSREELLSQDKEKAKKHADKNPNGFDPARVQLFFIFYYSMTGLHVLHMIIGIGLLLWQLIFAQIGFFNHRSRYVYIEVMSLYWHFVDMVWMFLLPLLYLCGPHTSSQAIEQFKMAIGLTHGSH